VSGVSRKSTAYNIRGRTFPSKKISSLSNLYCYKYYCKQLTIQVVKGYVKTDY